jgi:predicted peroxiredoxin
MKKNNQITTPILLAIAFTTVIVSMSLSYVVSRSVAEDSKQSHSTSDNMMQGKLMVHISSGIDEPHSQMMGLQKALKAKEAGSEVLLFMDVKATDLALKETNIKFADFPPSQELIADLIDKGVEVYVCPHCLMVNGNNMSEVQDGIQELTMDAMMSFGSGAGVTTLDY